MRILRKAGKFARKRERKGLWRGVVTGIAAVVVFCTTYALILPAITMETEGFSCGMAEHSHTQECYQLICGQQEYFSHSHADECYEGGQLVCTLTERTCHHHSADCYSKAQPACGQEELPAHSHGDGCYESRSVLTCGMEEYPAHSHGEECYVEGELTCTLAETQGHTHGEECYGEQKTLICGKEETPGHSHTAECYPADFQPELICGQEDIPEHRHSEACYARICEMEEHVHTELCVDSHEAFLENQKEILNDVTTPSNSDDELHDDDGTDATEASDGMDEDEADQPIQWNDPQAAEEAGYFLICTADEAEHVHDQKCYVPADELSQISQGMQYSVAPLSEGGVMPLADGDPVSMKSVASPLTVTGGDVSYDLASDSYFLNLKIDFTLQTAPDITFVSDPGGPFGDYWAKGTTYHVTDGTISQRVYAFNPSNDKWTWENIYNDVGTEFTINLGNLNIRDNGLFEGTHKVLQGVNQVGTYTLSRTDNGVVATISLDSEFVARAENGMSGHMELSASLGKSSLEGEEELKYTTPDGTEVVIKDSDVTYPPGTSRDGDVTVSKYGNYSFNGKELIYSVTVSSKNGTPGKVQIEDVLKANGLTIEALKSVKLDQTELSSDQYSYSANGDTHTFSMELDALPAGQWGGSTSRTITYVYQLAEAPESDTVVNNEVKASTRKDDSSDPLVSTDEKPVTVTPTPIVDTAPNLSKTNLWGDPAESKNQTVIPWKLTINDNNQNLSGMTLTDEMLKKLTNASDIKVWVDGSQVTDASQYGFTLDEGTGSISFPAGEQANTHKYEIIYYTPVPDELKQWGSAKVTNTAKLGDKEAPSEVTKSNGTVTKEKGTISSVADGKVNMDWTVEVEMAIDGVSDQFILTDYSRPQGWETPHYYQKNSIRLVYGGTTLELNSDYTITFYDIDQKVTTGEDAVKMEITFLKTGTNQEALGQGSKKLVLSYSTCAPVPSGETTYYNKVSYRGLEAYSDTTYMPSSVQKTDGNGQTGTTVNTNTDGKLVWKVKAVAGSLSSASKLTITDTLPEGVQLESLSADAIVRSLNWWYQNNSLTIAEDGSISGSNEKYLFSGSYSKENRTVTVSITRNPEGEVLPAGTEFTLVLNCKPTDEYLQAHPDKTGLFKNDAEAKLGEASLGTVSQTQEWKVTPEDPFENSLKKTGTWKYNDQTLDYQVVINPNGYDLNSDNSKLYLTDEFVYYPKTGELDLVYILVQNSVKLYTATRDENGNYVAGSRVTDGWRWTADEEQMTEFGKVKKIIRLEVPDSTPLILEYSYLLSQYNEEVTSFKLNASNKVYYNTNPDVYKTDNKEYQDWQKSSSSAIIQSGRSYTITKVAEGNSMITIAGAKFRIYQAVMAENGSWSWDKNPVTLTGTDGTVRTEYITDSYGKIEVEASHGYSANVLYKLQEYEAPSGYILPENPQELKFYFTDAADTTHSLPATSELIMQNARDLMSESASSYVSNAPSAVQFSVEKQWKDYQGNNLTTPPVDSIDLTLMRVGAERKENTTVNDPLASLITVNLIIGGYGSNGAPVNRTYTVPKGTVFAVDVGYVGGHQTPEGVLYLKEVSYDQKSLSYTHDEATDHYFFTYTATYSVCIEIRSRANEGYYTYAYSCTTPSTGSSEVDTTPVVVGPESYGTITLSAAQNWKWSSAAANLPAQGIVQDSNGNDRIVWYTYYVLEDFPGYTISYSNQNENGTMTGISTGNITVTNTQPENPPTYTSISVEKTWKQAVESQLPDSVSFKLYRKEWTGTVDSANLAAPYGASYDSTAEELAALADGTVTLVGEYQLTKDGSWKWSSSGMSLLAENQGKSYTYFILEQPGSNFDITYGTGAALETSNGTLTLTNTVRPSYMLPSTGGIGWEGYTVTGLVTSIGAVLGLMKKRKKGER